MAQIAVVTDFGASYTGRSNDRRGCAQMAGRARRAFIWTRRRPRTRQASWRSRRNGRLRRLRWC